MTQAKDVFQEDLASSKNSDKLYEDIENSEKSYLEKESTENYQTEKEKSIKQQDDMCLLHQKPL